MTPLTVSPENRPGASATASDQFTLSVGSDSAMSWSFFEGKENYRRCAVAGTDGLGGTQVILRDLHDRLIRPAMPPSLNCGS